MSQTFRHSQPAEGVALHVLAAPRFKTITLAAYLHRPLRAETVTATALLPNVLSRGSRKLPTQTALARRLDELYGASTSAGVEKAGEAQDVAFRLEVLDERFLPGHAPLWRDALAVLSDLIRDPLVEDGAFRADYVEQEKLNLGRRIQGLYNNKARYANVRCIAEMCRGEPYALHPLGSLEDLPGITPGALYQLHQEITRSAPLDIFVVGGQQAADLLPSLEDAFRWERDEVAAMPRTELGTARDRPHEVVEGQEVSQGKLSLGYRTGVTMNDDRYFALLVYNGILGGFPHSKLFRNVREKASLAYYAGSQTNALKGTLLVTSGIESANYERALEIIAKQVDDIARGTISDDELAFTRDALVEQIRRSQDSPGALIGTALTERMGGRSFALDERLAGIRAVTREQVVEVAQQVRLDTIFFLTNKGDRRVNTEPPAAVAAAAAGPGGEGMSS